MAEVISRQFVPYQAKAERNMNEKQLDHFVRYLTLETD